MVDTKVSSLGNLAKTLGVKIYPQVTIDVHRIFRMPGTISSKSGLVKLRCDDLERFDPQYDSCILGVGRRRLRLSYRHK